MAAFASVLLLLGTALVAAAVAAPQEQRTYSNRYDGVNLDEILNNRDELANIIKCFQEDTNDNCSEMGGRVKAVLPEALPGDCARCTDKQRGGLAKVVGFLAKSKPEAWKALQAKYDPQGAYAAKHPELFQ